MDKEVINRTQQALEAAEILARQLQDGVLYDKHSYQLLAIAFAGDAQRFREEVENESSSNNKLGS